MFTEYQKNYIREHLRRPDYEATIAKIAESICNEFNKQSKDKLSPEKILETAILMNLGETDPKISYIYDSDYNWKEYPEAIALNKLHGQYSVEMAEKIGISLDDEQKEAIMHHSEGIYETSTAQIIKAAEICKASQSPRMYRGTQKPSAQSFSEVEELLKENDINSNIITLTRDSYGKKYFSRQNDTNDENEEPEL